jgi:transcriptional regulator of arginine metabolism
MKSKRQEKILELIETHDIDTQEELAELLRQAGFVATQATVSRDIKELKLVKVSTGIKNGRSTKSKYSANTLVADIDNRFTDKFKNILSEMVLKISYAGHMVVLKTSPGMANATCVALDSLEIPDVVGTLAGDDTIFMVMATESQALDIVKKLNKSINKF